MMTSTMVKNEARALAGVAQLDGALSHTLKVGGFNSGQG